jgi:hypothetical protein
LKYPPKDCNTFIKNEYSPKIEEADVGKKVGGFDKGLEKALKHLYEDAIDETKHAFEHKSKDIKENHPGNL